jgi:ABC-type multidrug transport system ATPase subunit
MRLHEVGFRYSRRGPWILRGVTVQIAPGEIVVVRGRNGVGKSTLLAVAAGALRPQHGEVIDRPARIGWVPEHFPADQPFTVATYLELMAELRKAPATEVNRWISRLGLAAFRQERLGALSKGTAQKVGLAQALLVRPGLLLLDEPWEGLDDATRDLVPGIVDEVLKEGGSVLVSDHSGDTVRLGSTIEWTVAEGVVTVSSTSEESS